MHWPRRQKVKDQRSNPNPNHPTWVCMSIRLYIFLVGTVLCFKEHCNNTANSDQLRSRTQYKPAIETYLVTQRRLSLWMQSKCFIWSRVFQPYNSVLSSCLVSHFVVLHFHQVTSSDYFFHLVFKHGTVSAVIWKVECKTQTVKIYKYDDKFTLQLVSLI